MKRLNKGPEINLSKLRSGNLKPPKALGDLYRELKSQHLLPIVVLLVIGMIAIPVLVGGSSDRKSDAVASQAKIGGSSSDQAVLKVSKWTPGLLDYKKSLRGARPINPFAAKVAVGKKDSGSESSEVEPAPAPSEIEVSGGVEEAPSEVQLPAPAEPTPPPADDEGRDNDEASEEDTSAVTVDVQVTTVHEDGGVDRNPTRRDLPQLTKLPSEATPALTYVGPSEDGTKAMMAVSSEVTAMIGDSNCVVPAKPCSLLALQVGAPETVVYGDQGLTYRIELVRIGDHGNAKRNHPAPGHGNGRGAEPAPREADALIGVGSLRVVQRPFGL